MTATAVSSATATTAARATIRHHIISSPIGPILLAASDRGLVRVAFEREDFQVVLVDLRGKLGADLVDDTAAVADAAKELDEYFAGTRHTFSVPLDHRLSRGFRAEVQQFLATVPYGETRTYGQIAAAMGRPGAARSIGSGCGTNPLSIFLPCHRVVRSDGGLGGYLGGLAAKQVLLDLEAAGKAQAAA